MTTDPSDGTGFDDIMKEAGQFGLYQKVTYLLICIPNILSATYAVNYMFSANTLDYRCKVPECDIGANNREILYDQTWLHSAIPYSNGKIKNCVRYAPLERNGTEESKMHCNAEMFDVSREIACTEYIYSSDEMNLQTEFNIHCSDSYKLALIGTANNVGRCLFLPLTGFLSDKFGRLTVVIAGVLLNSVFGLIKSFSFNYFMYIIFECLESSAGACTYAGIYVLGIEWASSKYRVIGTTLITLSFPVGEMLLGLVAMYVHDFRTLIRVLYTPGLAVIVYLWLVPESVRWLLVTGQVDRALKILKRIASVNGKSLSDKTIGTIKLKYSSDSRNNSKNNESGCNLAANANVSENQSLIQIIYSIFRSKTLCVRFLICCYQWIAICFCYYGLSMSATRIHGENRYTSFIMVVGFEIIGIFVVLLVLNRMKRKILLSVALIIIAISTNLTPWIPEVSSVLVLVCFMLGKAAAMAATNIFTAEQWPTNLRATIMNSCSMVGRIGSMLAPVAVILGSQYGSLSAYLFGGVAIVGAFLVLFSAETYQKKLPDSIEEAKHL